MITGVFIYALFYILSRHQIYVRYYGGVWEHAAKWRVPKPPDSIAAKAG